MNTSSEDPCLHNRHWYYFLTSSLIVFFAGLALILAYRIAAYLVFRNSINYMNEYNKVSYLSYSQDLETESNSNICKNITLITYVQLKCEELLSAQHTVGVVMVCFYCIVNITSVVIYFIDALNGVVLIETCRPWNQTVADQIDLAANIFFLFHFILRLLTAPDKLKFWLELNSFVDYATIPPVIIEICINRQWLGLRFMRCFRLMNIPDIMQYLRLIKSGNIIRVAQLVATFFSVWTAAAGFIQLLEVSGDPFNDFSNAQQLTYLDCLYFVIITLSTVGYGDLSCRTLLGRTFIVVFIMIGLAVFAGLIPELVELVEQNRQKYKFVYKKEAGTKHIIVGGHITYESVQNFILDFHHEDRSIHKLRSIFVSTSDPGLKLEALVKRYCTKVAYVRASLMSVTDLKNIKLNESKGCIIMANQKHEAPNEEDAANIMRAISVKNCCPNLRVILQLMSFKSKVFCLNLPFWTEHDQVICISEMKLGIMATSSLVPGFSTLMSNLITMITYKKSKKRSDWMNDYIKGAGNEFYLGDFSPAFHGKKFPEVAEICYSRLGLLLVAVYQKLGKKKRRNKRLLLNPGPDFSIDAMTSGFFICQSEREARYAAYFCFACHAKKLPPVPKHCRCYYKGLTIGCSISDFNNNENDFPDDSKNQLFFKNKSVKNPFLQPSLSVVSDTPPNDESPHFESTGLFYWCPHRSYQSCQLTEEKALELKDHIILCCVDEKDATLSGLSNFVMPLRASSLPRQELKTIILLVEENEFLEKSWSILGHFSDVYVYIGSCLDRQYLRLLQIERCSMCVILTSSSTAVANDHPLIDKESILCHLIIKTMTFEGTMNKIGSGAYKAVEYLMRSYSRKDGDDDNDLVSSRFIPTLTELADEYNIQFLDQDDFDDPSASLYMAQPFACGVSFVSRVLDQIMSTVFFYPQVFSLIRTLVSGGDTQELEQVLAEGFGLQPCALSEHKLMKRRNRSRICMLSLDAMPLMRFANKDFGNMFINALSEEGILCMGLYRKLTNYQHSLGPLDNLSRGPCSEKEDHRIVITNPPSDFRLYSSDMVYCLHPFDTKKSENTFTGISAFNMDTETVL